MKPTWQTSDGSIRLWLADCLSVLPTLEAGSVELIVTDPQYGITQPGVVHEKESGKGSRSFDFFDNDSPAEATNAAIRACFASRPLLTESGSAYWWLGHYAFGPITSMYLDFGFVTRFLVWSKLCPCPPPPGSGWPSAAELCVYAFRPGRTWTHDGKSAPRSNVLVCDSYRFGQPGKVDHPTQKPFGVIMPLIKASSRPGDIVLDGFMGSGTTGVACVRTGRRFIGIEKEERYFRLAVDRISAELNRNPLFEPAPKIVQGTLPLASSEDVESVQRSLEEQP